MNKKLLLALGGAIASTCVVTNVYAENLIYGEEIPTGQESDYAFVENELIEKAYDNLKEEEATKLKIELEKSGYTSVTLNKYQVKTGVETDSIEKHFESLEEAMEYVKALENEGYTVTEVNFVNDIEDAEIKDRKFDSLEEAVSIIEVFKDTYENAEVTIEHENTDEVVEGTDYESKPFDSKEEAETALEQYITDKTTDDSWVDGSVVDEPVVTEEIFENTEFNSEKEANAAVQDLLDNGYVVDEEPTYTHGSYVEDGVLGDSEEGITFETEEQANAAVESFKEEYKENTDDCAVTTNYTDTVIGDPIEGTESYDTEDEAKEAMAQYIAKNETGTYYFVEGTVALKGTGNYLPLSVSGKEFESETAAMAYIRELTNAGYRLVNGTEVSFVNDTDSITGDYSTYEEALNDYNSFANGLIDVTAVEDAITRYENTDKASTFSQEEFETENSANEYIEGKQNEYANDPSVVVNGTVTPYDTLGEKVDIETEEFNSQAEAEEALNRLSSQYAKVSDQELIVTAAGTVGSIETFTAYTSIYQVGNTTYILFKHGNEIFVWTADEMSQDARVQFAQTYDEMPERDTVINNLSSHINSINFISGYNVEYRTKNGGTFSVTIEDNNEIHVNMESSGQSRLVFGTFTPVTTYKYVAKAQSNITKYKAEGTITDYDYKLEAEGVKASGKLTAQLEIEEEKYFFDVIKKQKTYTAKGHGSKTVVTESGVLNGKLHKDQYYFTAVNKKISHIVNAIGSRELESGTLTAKTEKDIIEDRYSLDVNKKKYMFVGGTGTVDNPETGDKSMWIFDLGEFSLIGLAATTVALKNEKKKAKKTIKEM